MTTIPPNFNPQIPARGTPEFARYMASMWEAKADGKTIVTEDIGEGNWSILPDPEFGSTDVLNYAILPDPEPSWPSDNVWAERFTDPKWQCLLVRIKADPSEVSSAELVLNRQGWHIHPVCIVMIGPDNFTLYEISHDGGKTWGPIC